MYRFTLLLSLTVIGPLVAAQERTFEGRWNNRRTGSNGTMTCTATEVLLSLTTLRSSGTKANSHMLRSIPNFGCSVGDSQQGVAAR